MGRQVSACIVRLAFLKNAKSGREILLCARAVCVVCAYVKKIIKESAF